MRGAGGSGPGGLLEGMSNVGVLKEEREKVLDPSLTCVTHL